MALLTVVAVPALGAASAVPADRAEPPKADLKVTAGWVTTTPARISGSLKVKNAGKKKAKRSTVSLRLGGTPVQTLRLGPVKKGKARVLRFSFAAPWGRHKVTACADAGAKVTESKEKNNCRVLGTVTVRPTPSPTAPTEPIPYTPGTVFPVDAAPLDYSLHVPTTYVPHHQTPTGLLVFLSGCGWTGQDFGELLQSKAPGLATKNYIVMTPDLMEGEPCWDTGTDPSRVMAAIADVKTHFNIAPRKVVIGGYSSGGFAAGATAFSNITQFAGVVTLCAPAYTGSVAQAEAIGDAGWRVNVVMRGHANDNTVNISALQVSRDRLLEAGFPLDYTEVAGLDHGYVDEDFVYLFGKISSAWTAPAP